MSQQGFRKAPRTRRACAGCQRVKAKCEAPDDLSAPCRRCTRLGLPCEYSERPRGAASSGPDGSANAVTHHIPAPPGALGTPSSDEVQRGSLQAGRAGAGGPKGPKRQKRREAAAGGGGYGFEGVVGAMGSAPPLQELRKMAEAAAHTGDGKQMGKACVLNGIGGKQWRTLCACSALVSIVYLSVPSVVFPRAAHRNDRSLHRYHVPRIPGPAHRRQLVCRGGEVVGCGDRVALCHSTVSRNWFTVVRSLAFA